LSVTRQELAGLISNDSWNESALGRRPVPVCDRMRPRRSAVDRAMRGRIETSQTV